MSANNVTKINSETDTRLPVYNIIMDFVFALFPWMITWKLDMRKNEKIGLCLTMSLGVV